MLDFQKTAEELSLGEHDCIQEIPAPLLEALSRLSDEALDEQEDELDFYAFTGVQGAHIRRLLVNS